MKTPALIEEFYETGNLPELNFLLDWRNHLMKLMSKSKDKAYYEIEISATDFLIDMYK